MEEKKLDVKTLIGFGLIMVLLIWMIYNQTSSAEAQLEKEKQEQVDKAGKEQQLTETNDAAVVNDTTVNDSISASEYKSSLGAFAYSRTSFYSNLKTRNIP